MTNRSLLSRLATALLLVACAVPVLADRYTLPSNITVNVPTDISIDVGVAEDSELRDNHRAYRVFLAVEPPGWGLGPICWLVNAVPLDQHNLTISVPRDVVPDETSVQISTGLILDNNPDRVNGYSYSGSMLLLGGNGTWIQRELDGWTIGDENIVSCWALGCTRDCHNQYYTGDETRISDGTGEDEADACVDQCVEDLNPKRRNGAEGRHVPLGALLTTATLMLACLSYY